MDRFKQRIGAGFLLLAAPFVGHETLVWLWGKFLDFLVGLFGGEHSKMTIPSHFPWWDATGLLLALIGVGFLVASFRGSKRGVNHEWTDQARLTLAFDNELQTASATRQEGVRYYYWYHFPAVGIDYERKEVQPGPGYVMVFMALNDPTYTSYSRVNVVGGGIFCELLDRHATGAVVRATGDMRGRTLDIRLGKDPIPLD